MNKNLFALLAASAMVAGSDDSFYQPSGRFGSSIKCGGYSDKPIKISDHRQLKEFSIKGNKVMAYSRKDAIKRLKYLKKI